MSSGVGTCSADRHSSSSSLFGGQTGWLLSTLHRPQWVGGRRTNHNEFQPLSQPGHRKDPKRKRAQASTHIQMHNGRLGLLNCSHNTASKRHQTHKEALYQQITVHQDALLMLLLPCGRWEGKYTQVKQRPTRIKSTRTQRENGGNSMQIQSSCFFLTDFPAEASKVFLKRGWGVKIYSYNAAFSFYVQLRKSQS